MKVLPTKHDDVGLVPGTHRVEREDRLLDLSSDSPSRETKDLVSHTVLCKLCPSHMDHSSEACGEGPGKWRTTAGREAQTQMLFSENHSTKSILCAY